MKHIPLVDNPTMAHLGVDEQDSVFLLSLPSW